MSNEKEYCPTCNHIIAKTKNNLSSIGFRRTINNYKSLDDVIDGKSYLKRFIKSKFKAQDYADKFAEDLDEKISEHNTENIDDIRLWLFSFINTRDDEMLLYQFLQTEWDDGSDIDVTFAHFYDRYCEYMEKPLNKNRVSRALLAFGISTVTKKIIYNEKLKCAICIIVTAEELSELLRKNGIVA